LAGEGTDDDAAAGSVQKSLIASFSVNTALVPVGGVVKLHCRVTRMDSGFVRLLKSIPDTRRQEVLTTNQVKERSIREIDRYSINATQYGDHGYDFIFTITGSTSVTIYC